METRLLASPVVSRRGDVLHCRPATLFASPPGNVAALWRRFYPRRRPASSGLSEALSRCRGRSRVRRVRTVLSGCHRSHRFGNPAASPTTRHSVALTSCFCCSEPWRGLPVSARTQGWAPERRNVRQVAAAVCRAAGAAMGRPAGRDALLQRGVRVQRDRSGRLHVGHQPHPAQRWRDWRGVPPALHGPIPLPGNDGRQECHPGSRYDRPCRTPSRLAVAPPPAASGVTNAERRLLRRCCTDGI